MALSADDKAWIRRTMGEAIDNRAGNAVRATIREELAAVQRDLGLLIRDRTTTHIGEETAENLGYSKADGWYVGHLTADASANGRRILARLAAIEKKIEEL